MSIKFNLTLIISILCMACTLSAGAIEVDDKVKSQADLGVINKEQIYYWLEKRGQLSSTATINEKKQALAKYLGKKSFGYKKLPGEYGKKYMFAQQRGYRQSNISTHKKTSVQVKSLASASQQNLASTEAKVLALMIDFTDLKHDQNGNNYPESHYSDLLFADTLSSGVESVYQYYQHESGGTLNFTGTVQGWLTADNDGAFYGGNDEDDDDQNVSTLVLEAITKAVSELNINLADYDLDNNGVIDHVMIFHASIGEEAGGGTLGSDAIWSHSSAVRDGLGNPVTIPGSNIKLYGYTINPIDAQIGVVAHEFGHDLGVRDEYDTVSIDIGSPVANWSIMASGSWVDGGAHPSGFSPHAKDYFQNQYGGNWVNQQQISFEDLSSETIALVSATNHQAGRINQVKINLPIKEIVFAPYEGKFQFYSNEGHQLNNSLSFDVILPAGSSALSMKAHWDIEIDYDYVQIRVNGNAIAGNYTQGANPKHNTANDTVVHYISNKSKLLSGAEGDLGWVDLSFDLSEFANQSITIKISYITDPAAKGYGFVADNINVVNNNTDIMNIDAETNNAMLNGFSRVNAWSISGAPHHYYLQLRSHTDTDKFLSRVNYDPGVLLWYRNDAFTNNDVTDHPGDVFIGVVDADQNAIKLGEQVRDTSWQIRDAAFSFFDQSIINGDSHLTASTLFDDKNDYSAPYQPESGLTLPTLGLTLQVSDQSTDSTTATVLLTNTLNKKLSVTFSQTVNNLAVKFSADAVGGDENYTYIWDFGDGNTSTDKNPEHFYVTAGSYNVILTVTDGALESANSSTVITVVVPVVEPPVVITPPTVTSSSGGGAFGVWLFSLIVILHLRNFCSIKCNLR
ncbi:MAG: immune inhibitor A [Alteromonadaceae bacterium]|jgi:immune inhibitor A